MYISPDDGSLIVSTVGVVLVAACSIPSLSALSSRLFSRNHATYQEIEKLYEDEDGQASEESQKASTAFWSRLMGLLCSVTATILSIAYATLVTMRWEHHGRLSYSWILVGAQALLSVQAVMTFVTRQPLDRFWFGLLAAFSSLIMSFNLFLEHWHYLRRHQASRVLEGLAWTQGAILCVAFLSFILIQRRPDVFKGGRIVDGQFTTSALSRACYTWCAPMLAYTRMKKNIDLDELPILSAYQRAQVQEEAYVATHQGGRLWKSLFHLYRRAFAKQTTIVILQSVTQLAPQFAMFKLLQILETRDANTPHGEAWAWTFALGFFMVVSAFLEALLFYVVWADVGMPVRSLLSMIVFSKATKRKDVKGTQKKKKKETSAVEAQKVHDQQNKPSDNDDDDQGQLNVNKKDSIDTKAAKANGDGGDDDDDTGSKSKQSTINLVGVDAKRVSDFLAFIYLYPGVIVKLIVSMTFLGRLVGWKALLAGLGAFAVSMPFNIVLSKLYNNAQGKLMILRDAKVAIINEALQGIRQIKFSAIEAQWEAKITEKRRAELRTQWKAFMYDIGLVSCWVFGPVMLSAVTLMAYTLIHGELSPSIAFTTIAILAQIEFVLAIIPELTTDALDAWVACNRIEEYLNKPERDQTSLPGINVKFQNATIAWPADEQEEDSDRFTLSSLTLDFPQKELSVISGKTGSGKSLLLAAIIGEIDKLDGNIFIPQSLTPTERFDSKANPVNWILDSSMAFVAQIPWIENATIRNNILFGLPYDQGRYRKVLKACALEKDLEILPDGDETDIGANGINLSGGQRWRVSFARAMYSRAGILVLDDIFSAVDAHVGRHLFEEALTGELGVGRTRILVTHHVGLCLSKTKYSVHLGEGTVQHAGLVEELKKRGELAEILKDEADAQNVQEEVEDEEQQLDGTANGHLHLDTNGDGGALKKVTSKRSTRSAKIDDGGIDTKGKANPKKYTEDEKREVGGIKLDIYWSYISSSGGIGLWTILVLVYLCASGLSMGRSYWVTIWTRSYRTEAVEALGLDKSYHSFLQVPSSYMLNDIPRSSSTVDTASNEPLWYWLGIYLALSFVLWFFATFKYFLSDLASIKASYKLFDEMNYTILRTPLRWLDTVPIGRILNRFSSDFNTIDSRMSGNMGYFFYQSLEMITITVAGAIASPSMVPLAVVLFLLACYIMKMYLNGAREVKRLESNARSPIFSDFGALLSGVSTVRAFDKTATYIDRMYTKIDAHGSAYYHIWLFNRWMGFRLSILGTAFAVAVAIVVVATRTIDAALAGFALNFALRYSSAIIWTMRGYSNVEMDLNSAERIIEYTRLPIEDQGGNPAPAAWPTSGRLEVDGLVASYAPDLPPVLKGLTFKVESGQRVGVVGRTGAGKSSLTLALFRFIHQSEGSVYIDGLDVSKIKLHDLRSRLAIIPQDPVLFSGTIRSNLDPFDEHSDADLRTALHRVHLVEETGTASRASLAAAPPSSINPDTGVAVATAAGGEGASTDPPLAGSDPPVLVDNKNVFTSLSSKVAEGGLNLSQGQRQLLCLARAIVSRPPLMLLDEATSAVDMATDELIQRSIREEFEGSTLLVIAHRLSTIADFDRILVMSEGRAVEFGSPKDLYQQEGGVFRGMVEASGDDEREKLAAMIMGTEDAVPSASTTAQGAGSKDAGERPSGAGQSGMSNLFG